MFIIHAFLFSTAETTAMTKTTTAPGRRVNADIIHSQNDVPKASLTAGTNIESALTRIESTMGIINLRVMLLPFEKRPPVAYWAPTKGRAMMQETVIQVITALLSTSTLYPAKERSILAINGVPALSIARREPYIVGISTSLRPRRSPEGLRGGAVLPPRKTVKAKVLQPEKQEDS